MKNKFFTGRGTRAARARVYYNRYRSSHPYQNAFNDYAEMIACMVTASKRQGDRE